MSTWVQVPSSSREALDIVDGVGRWAGHGAHYSRRSPGAKTFTGVGQEIVLVTDDLSAVWAVVRQRTPSRVGSGKSRGRCGKTDPAPQYIWRNMLFRNLGRQLSSGLIEQALAATYQAWESRYGCIPAERLRTEIGIKAVRSSNPGYCYKVAGWEVDRGKLYLWAPPRSVTL